MDYQPPTPAPAREHIIGEDEEEAGSNPPGRACEPYRPPQAQLPHGPRQGPRPTPPKSVTHPPSRSGVGGHPPKVLPPPLSTWGAPPASMAPPSGPMGRGGGGGGGNGVQPNGKTHSKPPGRSNKPTLPPLDVTLERKKSLNNTSLDVSTYCLFSLGIYLLE